MRAQRYARVWKIRASSGHEPGCQSLLQSWLLHGTSGTWQHCKCILTLHLCCVHACGQSKLSTHTSQIMSSEHKWHMLIKCKKVNKCWWPDYTVKDNPSSQYKILTGFLSVVWQYSRRGPSLSHRWRVSTCCRGRRTSSGSPRAPSHVFSRCSRSLHRCGCWAHPPPRNYSTERERERNTSTCIKTFNIHSCSPWIWRFTLNMSRRRARAVLFL